MGLSCFMCNLYSLGWKDRDASIKRCHYPQISRAQSPLNPFYTWCNMLLTLFYHSPIVSIPLLLPSNSSILPFTFPLYLPSLRVGELGAIIIIIIIARYDISASEIYHRYMIMNGFYLLVKQSVNSKNVLLFSRRELIIARHYIAARESVLHRFMLIIIMGLDFYRHSKRDELIKQRKSWRKNVWNNQIYDP